MKLMGLPMACQRSRTLFKEGPKASQGTFVPVSFQPLQWQEPSGFAFYGRCHAWRGSLVHPPRVLFHVSKVASVVHCALGSRWEMQLPGEAVAGLCHSLAIVHVREVLPWMLEKEDVLHAIKVEFGAAQKTWQNLDVKKLNAT